MCSLANSNLARFCLLLSKGLEHGLLAKILARLRIRFAVHLLIPRPRNWLAWDITFEEVAVGSRLTIRTSNFSSRSLHLDGLPDFFRL